ncbi:MAG: VWA domain-containing protein [Planctomycetes bacterium]|nr:VWA domain-containing protein [Planctomycetota bacterium]
MRATKILLAAVAMLLAADLASGQAIVEVRSRPAREVAPAPLPPGIPDHPVYITNHTVSIAVTDGAAVTEIDQVFHNPTGMILEGQYVFPLPSEAAVDRFSMFMDGREVQGEVMEAGKARDIYMSIVRKMRDPGLVELIGRKLIRASVFPIPANGDIRVKIQYSQALEQVGDLFEYSYPLNSRRFSKTPLKQVVLSVKIRSKFPIKSVYSPTHVLDISRKGETEIVASYEGKDVAPGSDFQLFYNLSAKDFGLGLLSHKTPREEGFFMMLVSPKSEFRAEEVIPKDVVFVLDTSGSMRGEKMEQARQALSYCLRGLRPADRFGLIDFSTEARLYAERLRGADPAALADAVEYVKGLQARGGTNINQALRQALALKEGSAGGRIFMVVFLTDGEPTIEVQDPAVILKNVKEWNKDLDRIFVFGVGYDLNVEFLDRIAEENRGSRDYVKPEEDVEVKLSAFFDKISWPVLADIRLEILGAKTFDVYPKKIPDMFKGTQALVFGRYEGSGTKTAVLRGRMGTTEMVYEFPVEFKESEKENAFVAGLWARRKVGHLLDEIRLNGFHQELKDEIVRLGKQYGIVTEYTSFLVVEDNPEVLAREGITRVRRGEDRRMPPAPGERAGVPTPTPSPTGTPTPTPTPTPSPAGHGPMAGGGGWSGGGGARPDGAEESAKSKEEKVLESERLKGMRDADKAAGKDNAQGSKPKVAVQSVAGKSFAWKDGVWTDQELDEAKFSGPKVEVESMGDKYFELLKDKPDLAPFFALGDRVKVLFEGTLYVVNAPAEKK